MSKNLNKSIKSIQRNNEWFFILRREEEVLQKEVEDEKSYERTDDV